MIEFKHVSKTYPNGTKGLKDVNLTIDQGEFVAIIGLSGAGKSTLIRTINRMIDITEGQLLVDGTDVMTLKGKSMRRFRRKIGMIFQSFNLVSRSTAIKNVLTSMVPDMPWWKVMLGIFSKEQKMHALEALDKVGILDKAYTRCDQLSGGQQQRVALARTLNQTPTIILADEPVAALDPVTAHQVMADFRRINEENDRLAARYDGDYAFVKTYTDAVEIHPEYDKEDIAAVMDVVYAAVKDVRNTNILTIQQRDNFVGIVKKSTTAALLKSGLYKKLSLKDWYTDILNETYANMKIF